MALSQAVVEAELQQRLKTALGTFTSTPDLLRLRMAILDGLRVIWHAKEWRFKNQTASLTTSTATGKGPYDPPADFYKLAQRLNLYRFACDEAQILAPIKDSATAAYFLWIDVETGKLFFANSPGDTTLTLNYQAEFDDDVANLAATISLFPGSVFRALGYLSKVSLYEDSPQFAGLAEPERQKGMEALEVAWQDYNQGQARQRQMSPRGLNGLSLDGMADPLPLRGPQRWIRRL
jgi:hypothetical protein